MLSFTSYTKFGLRFASFLGILLSVLGVMGEIAALVFRIVNPTLFSTATLATVMAIFIVGGLQLFFIGFLGEYIMAMNMRIMKRPLVIEEERINFDK